MRKASFEQMRSPVSASFTTSIAVAMGYETLSTRTIPVESVFLGMGDLQDKIQPMPVKVCMPSLYIKVPIVTNINFLLTISIQFQEIRL